MLIRGTILLLAVLNLGVAAWWLWRPAPEPQAFEQPVGVPRLVLLEEILPARAAAPAPPAAARTRPAPAALPEPVPPEAVEPEAVEPEASDAAPEPAAATLPRQAPEPAGQASVAGLPRCEGADAGEARGWRVYLPPAPDLATAEATARRIEAAGFSDFLVLRDGESANGISLGMYSTEASAQRRSAALRAGGFPARCARIPATTPA